MGKTAEAIGIIFVAVVVVFAVMLYFQYAPAVAFVNWATVQINSLSLDSIIKIITGNIALIAGSITAITAIGAPIYKWLSARKDKLDAEAALKEQTNSYLAKEVQNSQQLNQLKQTVESQKTQLEELKTNTDMTELQNENIQLQQLLSQQKTKIETLQEQIAINSAAKTDRRVIDANTPRVP